MSQSTLSIIILVVIMISFAAQKIPAALTALLGAIAMAVCGIITPAQAVSSFGSDTVMMIAGVMLLGNAVFETGLANRIGHAILNMPFAAKSEKSFLFVVVTFSALVSMFFSNAAVVAIVLPMISSAAKVSNGKIRKKGCYMAAGVASVVGGNCSLAGSTPQVIAQGILETTSGVEKMQFFDLFPIGIALVAVLLLYYATIGHGLQNRVLDFSETGDDAFENAAPESNNTKKQIIVGVIFVLCIIGFATEFLTFGLVALLGASACILTGCISEKRAYETMDWGTLIILGGSMGFSKGLEASGAVEVIAKAMLGLFGDKGGAFALLTILIVISCVISQFMSNGAVVAIVLPIALSIALELGSNPLTFAIGVIIGANSVFATPIGTVPMTMTWSCGYKFSDYVKVGGLFNVIVLAIAIFLVPLFYGL